jgi:hypothetical protein
LVRYERLSFRVDQSTLVRGPSSNRMDDVRAQQGGASQPKESARMK